MSEAIEDRLRRAARNLQMKQASSRPTPRSGRTPTQDFSTRQVTEPNHFASANVSLAKKHRVAKYAWQKLAIVAAVTVLLVGVGACILFTRSDNSVRSGMTPKLPAAIISQISDFTPYLFRSAAPQGFNFNAKNVSYSAGVLFFQGQDQAANIVVVSEQILPAEFLNDKPQGDQNVSGAEGVGAISSRDSRIVGTLFTDKSPRTLITVSASDTVTPGTIKSIMVALKPVNR